MLESQIIIFVLKCLRFDTLYFKLLNVYIKIAYLFKLQSQFTLSLKSTIVSCGGDKEFVKSESEDEEIHTKNYYVCVSFFAKSLHNLFFFDSRKYT